MINIYIFPEGSVLALMKKQVIIIGAGPAGITAALELLKKSDEYQVVVLEASQEIGGLSRTIRYHGNCMDIGDRRFYLEDAEVSVWRDAFLSHRGASGTDACDSVMPARCDTSLVYYKGKLLEAPVEFSPRTIRHMGLGTSVKAGVGYIGSAVKKLPEDSLESFYVNHFGRQLYTMFFEEYAEKLWGHHPGDISADWGTASMREFSPFLPSKERTAGRSESKESHAEHVFFYPKRGSGQLWEMAADEVVAKGGVIYRGCRVTHFDVDGGSITGVHYTDANGVSSRIGADMVISSMPLKDLLSGLPSVPEDISYLAQGLAYRDLVTVGLLLDKAQEPAWEKTLGQACRILVPDTDIKSGCIRIFNNLSPDMVADPETHVWISLEYFCTEGDDYWHMSEEAWVNLAVSELMRMGIIHSRKSVADAHRECVSRAYPMYVDVYDSMDRMIGYLDTVDNLRCVGGNGQHRYSNTEREIKTALAAVRSILSGSTDQRAVWCAKAEVSVKASGKDFRDVTVKKIPKKEYKPPITIRIGRKKSPKAGKK